MIFKVYAKCCYSSKPISMIYENEVLSYVWDALNGSFSELFNYDCPEAFQDDYVNFCNGVVIDAALDYFNQNGMLECGDYALVKCDDVSKISRANGYGYSRVFMPEEYKEKFEEYKKSLV